MQAKTKIKFKGEKSFYCELCLVELNSEDTMISHRNGMKHLKKEQAEKQRRIKTENEAGMSEPERVSYGNVFATMREKATQ